MSVKKGQLIELTIDKVTFGGKGITRVEGMALFVDGTVPGDRVLAQVVKKKKSYAEARVVELLAPSAQRVKPPCACSGHCGGCKWQFLDYSYQLLYKQQHVRDALEHIALIKDVPVHATIGSEKIYGYRNKMEFSCSNRRWLLPEELGREDVVRGMALGLHVPGTFDKVMDIEACLLQPELGNRILGDVRRHIQASSLPPYDLRSHEGFWRFLVLRHSVAFDEWMVNLVTSWEAPDEVRPLAAALTARYPNIATVVNNISTRVSGVATGERETTLHGPGVMLERIGPFTFELSANSFFQTNTRGAERLYGVVKEYAALSGEETVLDLYCGTGTIAIYLAEQAKEVIGLEVVEGAVVDARRNCERNGIANCRFIAGDVRHTFAQVGGGPQVMVIDPPRSGMHADVVKQVMALGPRKIVYVSCNPATMARDLVLLKEAYEVAEVQPVDMFPHTFHVEAVALLNKK